MPTFHFVFRSHFYKRELYIFRNIVNIIGIYKTHTLLWQI